MTDPTQKFVTVKVHRGTKRRLDDEQDRIRRETERKPTLDEIVRAALDAYFAKSERGTPSPSHDYQPRNFEAHDTLEYILKNDPKAGRSVLDQLRLIADGVRARAVAEPVAAAVGGRHPSLRRRAG